MKTKIGMCKDSTRMERINKREQNNGKPFATGNLGAGGFLRIGGMKSGCNYRSPVLLPWRIPLLHLLILCILSTLLKNIFSVLIGANVSASDIQQKICDGVVCFNSLTTIPIEL